MRVITSRISCREGGQVLYSSCGMSSEAGRIQTMFSSIAGRYDLANHFLSCGMDFSWRRRAADIVAGWRPHTIADLATGTGDLALALQKKLPASEITGVDFVPAMLELARRKGVRRVVLADAMNLPFGNASFDCLTIAFGLRNFESWTNGIAEMARVLKDNGHLLVMEFSLPSDRILRSIYRFYLHRCLPLLGSLLTGERSAYAYLGESIEQFPSGNTMCQLISAKGFRSANFEALTGGIVTIYRATKS